MEIDYLRFIGISPLFVSQIMIMIVIVAIIIIGNISFDSLLSIFKDFDWDQDSQNSISKKFVNIAIRCTNHVFCRGKKM